MLQCSVKVKTSLHKRTSSAVNIRYITYFIILIPLVLTGRFTFVVFFFDSEPPLSRFTKTYFCKSTTAAKASQRVFQSESSIQIQMVYQGLFQNSKRSFCSSAVRHQSADYSLLRTYISRRFFRLADVERNHFLLSLPCGGISDLMLGIPFNAEV